MMICLPVKCLGRNDDTQKKEGGRERIRQKREEEEEEFDQTYVFFFVFGRIISSIMDQIQSRNMKLQRVCLLQQVKREKV